MGLCYVFCIHVVVVVIYLVFFFFFEGFLKMGVVVSLTLLPDYGTFFLLLGFLIQPLYEVLFLVLLHLVMLCLFNIPGSPAFFEGTWWKSGSGGDRKLVGGN